MITTHLRPLTYETLDEDTISWECHNDIHRALNLAYHPRTNTFLKKSYGHQEPIKRIICRENGTIIGHTAIFEVTALLPKPIKIGGIGMTLSLKPHHGIAHELRRQAAQLCADLGYPFAVGRVENTQCVKANLADITATFIDVPLQGTHTHSHTWETLAIYATGNAVTPYLDTLINAQALHIQGDIF